MQKGQTQLVNPKWKIKPGQAIHCTEGWRCLICVTLLRCLSDGGVSRRGHRIHECLAPAGSVEEARTCMRCLGRLLQNGVRSKKRFLCSQELFDLKDDEGTSVESSKN